MVGDFNSVSHLDRTDEFDWPVHKAVHAHGFTDAFRVLKRDDPGFTWTTDKVFALLLFHALFFFVSNLSPSKRMHRTMRPTIG